MNDTSPQNISSSDMMKLVTAATEAISDSMVNRMASTASNAMEVLDHLNDEDTRDALGYALYRLTKLHRQGGLDTIFDSLELMHGARMALTDSMVNRMFHFIEHMVNNLGNEEMLTLVHNAHLALEDTKDQVRDAPEEGGGIMGMLTLLRNPETLKALRFMLTYSTNLQQRVRKEDFDEYP